MIRSERMVNGGESALSGCEVHHLRSEHVGDEFKIVVGHCGASRADPGPVLYMGDAWANFGTAVETIRLMRLTETIPPTLVIAVGYRTDAMSEISNLRCRDFTPTVDLASGFEDAAMMGGADRFSAFLCEELKPWVADRYDVEPEDSMFFGDSLGGLFATHVLLSEPAAFRRYGIGSPALWWGDGLMFEREADYAGSHEDLPAKVFFSVGAYETVAGRARYREQLPADLRARAEAEDEADPPADMVADTERMARALRGRGYPSLEIECEVLPGEYHETAPPLNLSRALRFLFDAPR